MQKTKRKTKLENLGIDMVTAVGIELVGDLIDGGSVFFEFAVGIGWSFEQGHIHVLGIALIEFHGLHEAEDNEAIMGKHADVAIVIEKDAAIFGLHLEEVPAEEHGLVRAAQQPEQGGRN